MHLKHLHGIPALRSGQGIAVSCSALAQDEVSELALDGVDGERRAGKCERAASHSRDALLPRCGHSAFTNGQLWEVLSGVVRNCKFRRGRKVYSKE